MRYKRKPLDVEAAQFFHNSPPPKVCYKIHHPIPEIGPHIHSRLGIEALKDGDWIVYGEQGEVNHYTPDVFESTFIEAR